MSKIECKYKFQDPEKFNGKSYCLLHNELCEDISFACDTNCKVYEDYKQLLQLQEENQKQKAVFEEMLNYLIKKIKVRRRYCDWVYTKSSTPLLPLYDMVTPFVKSEVRDDSN